MRERLLGGLLSNDVVAFHTESFARNFLLCAQELLQLPVDFRHMTVQVSNRRVAARYYPISIDVQALETLAGSDAVQSHVGWLEQSYLTKGRRLLVRVDRTDPSKNIVRGFLAYARMLEKHPELHSEVTFLAVLQPSRQDVPEYADYLARIGATAAQINATYGREGYQPIDLRLQDDRALAVAACTVADVVVINSLADGMNLVAKEAVIVSRRHAALALSENTGAYQELGRFAVTLHPFDIEQQADALYAALTMDRQLRRLRREVAAAVVRENSIAKWISAQTADLATLTGLRIDPLRNGGGG
jgi:trehalose 6-phosphate synthase